ncbi:MAG: LysM domain-containing protein [Chthoniobacteraceae bacterium]|jgi:LysM repeat protein
MTVRLALAILLCSAPGAPLLAQDAANSSGPSGDQLRDLRQMIEQQSKQIDVLAQEIARLNLLLEGKKTPPDLATGSEETDQTAGTAAPDTATTPAGPIHIVTKGETLTAIAKRYKVTVPELLKMNKISDVRRLQIGQQLVLPPNAKIPASPTPHP